MPMSGKIMVQCDSYKYLIKRTCIMKNLRPIRPAPRMINKCGLRLNSWMRFVMNGSKHV